MGLDGSNTAANHKPVWSLVDRRVVRAADDGRLDGNRGTRARTSDLFVLAKNVPGGRRDADCIHFSNHAPETRATLGRKTHPSQIHQVPGSANVLDLAVHYYPGASDRL